jgi:adenine phosphoribosyltransferase
MELTKYIRDIVDFPKEGIVFKDITPLLKAPEAVASVISSFEEKFKSAGVEAIVGIESRGFIFGIVLAQKMGLPFIPVRKPGKLPAETVSASYELEYGTDSVEIHKDALAKGQKVLIVDDLLATGGTAAATTELIEKIGAEVAGIAFVIELGFLNGRAKLDSYDILSLINYE